MQRNGHQDPVTVVMQRPSQGAIPAGCIRVAWTGIAIWPPENTTRARSASPAARRESRASPSAWGRKIRCGGTERDSRPPTVTDLGTERIHRRSVLNGLINEYTRAA